MPQGRRKLPFSAKQKKLQLQNKRKRKTGFITNVSGSNDEETVQKINQQPRGDNNARSNRYALQFFNETREELQKRKEQARQRIIPVTEENLEIDIDNYFLPELDFPKRPPWNFDISKSELDARENRYLSEYINSLKKKFNWEELSYFELNLETWRQLWRVLEMSDIILFIVDIRFAAIMFPPSLYSYVVENMKKEIILVLNKADLAAPEVVVAWKHYFKSKFPSLNIVVFTSYPAYNLHGNLESSSGLKNQKRRGHMKMAVEGAQKLQEMCNEIVNNEVDLTSWKRKIDEEKSNESDEIEIGETIETKTVNTSYHQHVKYGDGVLTIGCIGQPNAGKSSVINALMGKKVVSVSKTPGHTKHFQTIYITPNIRLCDCPGLVFPSKVPKVLQVLMGSFPIAQLREPYTTVKYISERIDLVKMLRLQHPDDDEEWCAMDICDAWAKVRGFYTARAARLDASRAANHLLRITLEGKICLCLRPVGYSQRKDYWETHPDIKEIKWVQAQNKNVVCNHNIELSDDDEEESDIDRLQKERSEDESGNASDLEDGDDDDDDDDSEPKVNSGNKFSALADDDE